MTPSLSGAESPRELLALLSRRLDGWSMLLDVGGGVELAEPADAARHYPVVQLEYQRIADGRGGSSSWGDGAGRAVLQPVVTAGRLHGYLAAGTRSLAATDMDSWVWQVRNMLAFQIDKSRAVRRAERSFRSAVMQLLLAGLYREAELAVRRADIALPRGPVRVAAVSHVDGREHTPVDRVIDFVEGDLPLAVADALCGEDDHGNLAIVVSAVEGDVDALRKVAQSVPGVRVAASEPVGFADVVEAAREAERLAESIGRDSPLVTTRATAYGSGLLAQIDGPRVRAFVESLLAPIVEADEVGSIDLLETLRVFLDCDGRWSEASDQLGIHRHTLRYRIKKVEDLLGKRLEDTGTRAELWIALRICGH